MENKLPKILEELYTGEGRGEKYGGIPSAVICDPVTYQIPKGYDVRRWAELLLIKHALLKAEYMIKEGDFDSVIAELKSSSCCPGEVRK